MKLLLAASVLSVVLLGKPSSAAYGPPAAPVPVPLQSLPHGDAGVPQLTPELEGLFGPIERVVGRPIVVPGRPAAPAHVATTTVVPAQMNPCLIQTDPQNCVLAYRFAAEVNNVSAEAFGRFIMFAKAVGAKRIMLELTTDGGLYPPGHEITRAIEMFPGAVTCVADGTVASMGIYILQACDRRIITKRGILMIHHVLAHTPEAYMNASQLRERAAQADVYTSAYLEQVAGRSKMTAKQVRAKTTGRDWHLNADKALELGFVDVVVPGAPNHVFEAMYSGRLP